jgi:choline transport protein
MATTASLRRRSVEPETEAGAMEVNPTYTASSSSDIKKPALDLDESPVDGDAAEWGDTPQDVRDMQRLGKKQEFKRNFAFLSTLGFVSIYMATWEFVLVSFAAGLSNGGFAGLFWCFITTVLCYATIVASLAEMESMAPTSG